MNASTQVSEKSQGTKSQDIEGILNAHDVVLFMKGSSDFPQCGFSATASAILRHLNVQFHEVDVLRDQELRQNIKAYADWPTIPQLYIKGEFVGGCDIIREMYQDKELDQLLGEKQIAFQRQSAPSE